MIETSGAAHERTSVMLVTRNLPPLRGGMERLNLHIAIELSAWFQVRVVGPVGCRDSLPLTVDVREARARPLWKFLIRALLHSLGLARRVRPKVVLAGSGLTAPIAVLAARLSRGHCAVYAHGLDIIVRHWTYQVLWLPFMRRCDLCIVNSHNTARLATQSGIRPERIRIIHPGVALPDESRLVGGGDFRRRHQLAGRKMLLSVGRLTRRKGVLEFVRNALPQIVALQPDVVYVVIGDEAPDALNGAGAGTIAEIRECSRELALDRNVLMLGACSEMDLDAAYSAADLCIFPIRDIPGDVEGFGMVAIEAAAFGLPTVAFDVGGVSDAIAEGCSGWLVPSGDYAAMAKRIVAVLTTGPSVEMRSEAIRFAKGFAWTHFGSNLRDCLLSLIASGEASE